MNRRSKNTPFSMDSLVASIDYIQISCHGTAPHFGANLCGLRGGIAVLAVCAPLPQQPSDQISGICPHQEQLPVVVAENPGSRATCG